MKAVQMLLLFHYGSPDLLNYRQPMKNKNKLVELIYALYPFLIKWNSYLPPWKAPQFSNTQIAPILQDQMLQFHILLVVSLPGKSIS